MSNGGHQILERFNPKWPLDVSSMRGLAVTLCSEYCPTAPRAPNCRPASYSLTMPNVRSLLLGCALLAPPVLCAQTASPAYDLIIRNARIVDGTGNPWFRGDVAIRGSQIAAVGRVHGTAKRTIDARDRVVSPGFIDMMGTGSTPHLTEPSAAG